MSVSCRGGAWRGAAALARTASMAALLRRMAKLASMRLFPILTAPKVAILISFSTTWMPISRPMSVPADR